MALRVHGAALALHMLCVNTFCEAVPHPSKNADCIIYGILYDPGIDSVPKHPQRWRGAVLHFILMKGTACPSGSVTKSINVGWELIEVETSQLSKSHTWREIRVRLYTEQFVTKTMMHCI